MTSILVITEGPPPLGSTPAEGGALRAWGLAKGFIANGHNVTIAYRSTYKLSKDSNNTDIPHGLAIDTWDGDKLDSLLSAHKIIVLRYAMGEAEEIVKRLSPEHILVSDSYVPISIEVSARNSDHKDEHINFLRLQETSAIATRRADYFLYASPAQKNYYLGYLSGLNKINPTTYPLFKNRLFEVPYGVDKNDLPNEYKTPSYPKNPTMLWYGAFYSWFDMESLIESILELKKRMPNFKLLIAGAKNPYNKDPGLLAHYEKTMKSLTVLGDSVEMLGWTAFDKRFEIYNQASSIITFNHLGLENELAWRTRLMDYILSYKPIITNGGDPLGEDLILRKIAYKSEEKSIADTFEYLYNNPPNISIFNEAIDRYSWQNVTKDISKALNNPSNLPNVAMRHKEKPLFVVRHKTKKTLMIPVYTTKYMKKHGVKKTVSRIRRGA